MALFLSFCLMAQEKQDSLKYAFLDACYAGNTIKINGFLALDSTILNAKDANGVNALMFAAAENHYDACELLLNAGIDVTARDLNGNSALALSVLTQGFDIAELLAYRGLDVNSRNLDGKTPLHLSAALNDSIMTDMLIFYGANINAMDESSSTPLHYAAYFGAYPVLMLLLQNGAKPNIVDGKGFTPIMLAAQNEKEESFKTLYSSGGSLLIRNSDGFNCLDILNVSQNIPLLSFVLLDNRNESITEAVVDSLVINAINRNLYVSQGFFKQHFRVPLSFPKPSSVFLSVNQQFSTTDYFTGVSLGLYDKRYRVMLSAGYSLRPYAKRLWVVESSEKLQVWEWRSFYFAAINYYHPLVAFRDKFLMLSTGAGYAYSSFRYYGYSPQWQRSGFFTANTGLALLGKKSIMDVCYHYAGIDATRTSPHQLLLGFRFNLNSPKPFKQQKLSW